MLVSTPLFPSIVAEIKANLLFIILFQCSNNLDKATLWLNHFCPCSRPAHRARPSISQPAVRASHAPFPLLSLLTLPKMPITTTFVFSCFIDNSCQSRCKALMRMLIAPLMMTWMWLNILFLFTEVLLKSTQQNKELLTVFNICIKLTICLGPIWIHRCFCKHQLI